jgi:hypothetical protein
MTFTNYKLKFHMYVKGIHMKLRLKFHMRKVSHEITNYNEISHVKGFHMKLQAVAAPGLTNWRGGRI